jgi:hypothetical protein
VGSGKALSKPKACDGFGAREETSSLIIIHSYRHLKLPKIKEVMHLGGKQCINFLL